MPILQQYYLDSTSLATATCVYIDSALISCAPDGFYSDGVITREQVGCTLLPDENCPECGLPCDGLAEKTSASLGVYNVQSNTGISQGAILVRFYIDGTPPIGFKAIHNGQTYNKLSSSADGWHQSSNILGSTYVGDSALNCGIVSGNVYTNVPTYDYNGTIFVNQMSPQTVIVTAGDLSLGAVSPQTLLMVIPKATPAPSLLEISAAAVCSGNKSHIYIQIDCPTNLPEISASIVGGDSCDLPISQTLYFASVTASPNIDVNDYVFNDSFGQVAAPDGFYTFIQGATQYKMEVVNGIVVAISGCCPSSTGTSSTVIDSTTGWDSPASIGPFAPLVYRARTNNGAWTAPTTGVLSSYYNNFGSNPFVFLDAPEFEACLEVEIGVQWGGDFFFPSDPGFPGWVWPNCAVQSIATVCSNNLNNPPVSTSPFMSMIYTTTPLYRMLMSPDPSTAYSGDDRYGNPVTGYWRFTTSALAWYGGATTISDPIYGTVGPAIALDIHIYEPI
jgi:hypothetical protein